MRSDANSCSAGPRQVVVTDSSAVSCLVIAASPTVAGAVELRPMQVKYLDVLSGVPIVFEEDLMRSVPRACPVARPRIGRGSTIAGQTPWQMWSVVTDERRVFLGLEAEIDTSAAGFSNVPCYFVQISGSMFTASSRLPLLPFGHISSASKDGFVFRLLMPWINAVLRQVEVRRSLSFDLRKSFRGGSSLGALSLAWVGIQSDNRSQFRPPPHRIEVVQ